MTWRGRCNFGNIQEKVAICPWVLPICLRNCLFLQYFLSYFGFVSVSVSTYLTAGLEWINTNTSSSSSSTSRRGGVGESDDEWQSGKMGQDFRKACYYIWVENILFIGSFSHEETFNICLRVPKFVVLFNFVSFVGFWQLEEATCEFVIQISLTLFLKFLL